MDDMRNTSAPLYGKVEPATTKTTMSVREMRQLLGLGKTDSYWLLHKNLFEVILINDKRRIVISSFEKWYLVIPFVLDAIITFILSRLKVEEANEQLRAAMNN